MSVDSITLLLLEDDDNDARLVRTLLEAIPTTDYEVWRVRDHRQAEQLLVSGGADVALLAERLGVRRGVQLLQQARARGSTVPVIFLSDRIDRQVDLDAMRAGADDCMAKATLRRSGLERAIRYAWERGRLERSLVESDETLRLLQEAAPEAIVLVDPRGRVATWNPAATRLFGYRESQALGRNIHELLAPAPLRGSAHDALRVFRQTGEGRMVGRVVEVEAQRADGTTFPAELTVSATRRRTGWWAVGTVRSLVVRRAAEQERERLLAQVEKAQRLESLVVMAGGIAHDFNNLLTVVLGNLSLALDEASLGSEPRAALVDARAATRGAADLAHQMLAFSGRVKVFSESVDLGRLVADMEPLLRATVPRNLRLQVVAGVAAPVRVDVRQVRQVVLNLVTNAQQALRDGDGTVTLTVGEGGPEPDCEVLGEVPSPSVWLQVSDDGPGMDANTAARAFEPFFTTGFTGRGLGLPVVLGVVRSHRGAVGLRTELGAGTVVRVFLPQAEPVPHPEPQPVPPPPVVRPRRVLVVDDEGVVRRTVRRILERRGLQVDEVGDGLAAVERFSADPARYDLVLLDLTMPGMDGAEVLVALREVRPDVPVLLASGYAEEEARERIGDTPAGFIQKPFSIDELAAAVLEALA